MAELGTGLIWMVAELALERKNQGFFQVAARHILVGGCSGFGLVVGGWEREKNGEMENKDEERRERDFLYYFIV